MLLQHSRRDARVDETGGIVLLPDQDRSRWHLDEIDEAVACSPEPPVTSPLAGLSAPGYVAAEHATAGPPEHPLDRFCGHYAALVALKPSPPCGWPAPSRSPSGRPTGRSARPGGAGRRAPAQPPPAGGPGRAAHPAR